MKLLHVAAGIVVALLFILSGTTAYAGSGDIGEREYAANCANCHGAFGKGDGPFVEMLKNRPTDLTALSKNNGGVFPFARVYEYVDGTNAITAHGTRDMPIWGKRYQVDAAKYYGDMDYNQPSFVRSRILALVEHIFSLQGK